MGASGKKLQGHGARRKGTSPAPTPALGGWGVPPHPLRIVNGQRYASLIGRTRRPFVVTNHLSSGRVFATRTDASEERFTLTAGRLLAADPGGAGRYYRFLAYTAGRRYRTYAFLAALHGDQALLHLPDWHPGRPVRYPARLLPNQVLRPGTWMRCSADLGQAQGAQLNLADLEPCSDPGPRTCHRASLPDPPAAHAVRRPAFGRGCGDIVLELVGGEQAHTTRGALELFVGVPVVLERGARAYLAPAGADAITGYLQVHSTASSPNGTRLRCSASAHPTGCPIAIDQFRVQRRWRWRWWPRELETPAAAAQLADYRYDPAEHDDEPGRSQPTTRSTISRASA
jgi:hypothetical protein